MRVKHYESMKLPQFHKMQPSADPFAIRCIVWFAKWLKVMKAQCSSGSANVTMLRKKPY